MIVAILAHLVFRNRVAESPDVAGLLVGVYTGGTPNLAAISRALKVPHISVELESDSYAALFKLSNLKGLLTSLGIALFVAALGGSVFLLVSGESAVVFTILALTTLSLAGIDVDTVLVTSTSAICSPPLRRSYRGGHRKSIPRPR
jgi:MFS superfamily sulfate permease-like transporter